MNTATQYPCYVLCKEGLTFFDDIPKTSTFNIDFAKAKLAGYAPNKVIIIDEKGIVVLNQTTKEVIKRIEMLHIDRFSVSPSGRYITVWQLIPLQYTQGVNGSGPVKVKQDQTNTLSVFDIQKETNEPIFSLLQKQIHVWPIIQFNITETVAIHLGSTVTFYNVSESSFVRAEKQFNNTVVRNFAWSTNPETPDTFALFVPENSKKNVPATFRVGHFPDIVRVISSSTFFKAGSSELIWSPRANIVLCKAQTNIDSTGQSYYGESFLHIVNVTDSSKNMSLPQPDGPVYDVSFNNDGSLLASVAGYMPATVEIFRVTRLGKLESIKKFPKQSRNEVKFSPNNQFLAVAGFGNCPGEVDVYETTKWNLVAEFSAHCTTEWYWTYDSKALVFCGCFPRRHFDNFIKVCPINAQESPSIDFGDRLYHLNLKPQEPIKDEVHFTIIQKKKEEETAAYVPPSLRGKPSCVEDDNDPMPGQHAKKVSRKPKKKTTKSQKK
ncbi:eukaryotic translation initiation factor 2A, putative [Entamoeba dispar SAW760]|uniref:Eukaryotic translation initiation factor 2A n=1 Tax=Entamoeba dispar (strain ATCC PRA-260 / SAW760) TaxID=370354 RepID=B0ETY8_ENTDS|nr:eukaryotic translation initiation factor 2A, putative [Entamoeba dispar SAW760]EDR22045.1 eukaryotic translation initiation factor 2A, putative [Entamoeba dispar SAW760]|eukprot:EDR22045.1 eukaryotic translation initiation factor 2A, putative [Entamoeba dispar SAW760]